MASVEGQQPEEGQTTAEEPAREQEHENVGVTEEISEGSEEIEKSEDETENVDVTPAASPLVQSEQSSKDLRGRTKSVKEVLKGSGEKLRRVFKDKTVQGLKGFVRGSKAGLMRLQTTVVRDMASSLQQREYFVDAVEAERVIDGLAQVMRLTVAPLDSVGQETRKFAKEVDNAFPRLAVNVKETPEANLTSIISPTDSIESLKTLAETMKKTIEECHQNTATTEAELEKARAACDEEIGKIREKSEQRLQEIENNHAKELEKIRMRLL